MDTVQNTLVKTGIMLMHTDRGIQFRDPGEGGGWGLCLPGSLEDAEQIWSHLRPEQEDLPLLAAMQDHTWHQWREYLEDKGAWSHFVGISCTALDLVALTAATLLAIEDKHG